MDEKYDEDMSALPSNSVDLESYNTRPGYKEIDLDSIDGMKPEDVLMLITRDERLGNLNPKLHDTNWFWDRLDLAMHILSFRKGQMKRASIMALTSVAALTETSLSIKGFLRKIQKTSMRHETGTYEDMSGSKRGGLFGLGKKKRNNDIYGTGGMF